MHKRAQTNMTLCIYAQPFANKHGRVQTCRSHVQTNRESLHTYTRMCK